MTAVERKLAPPSLPRRQISPPSPASSCWSKKIQSCRPNVKRSACMILAAITLLGGFELFWIGTSASRYPYRMKQIVGHHPCEHAAQPLFNCKSDQPYLQAKIAATTEQGITRTVPRIPLAALGQQIIVGEDTPLPRVQSQQFQLTRELVLSRAADGVVIVTWANNFYRDFVMNWVEHLLAAGCRSFLVGAMDDELLQFLADQQVPVFAMGSTPAAEHFEIGSSPFKQMGRDKVLLAHAFASMGVSILVSDVDTVWLRNPLPYLSQYPSADILVSSDMLTPSRTDGGLEMWERARQYAVNIGVVLLRPAATRFTEEWVRLVLNNTGLWDQKAFNDLLRRGWQPVPDNQNRLFMGYGATMRVGVLPVLLFTSGHLHFVQRLPHRLGVMPFVVHAIFQKGHGAKRMRMREAFLFNDPPEYFLEEGGFLAYDPALPPRLLEACRRSTRNGTLAAANPHFDLVNYQLRQVRAQFALARALGRAAVLPPFWCGMDSSWRRHNGVLEGSHLKLPFQCPADHLLDIDAVEAGGAISIREHSFLDNPRAATLRGNALTIVVCQEGEEEGCGDGTNPPTPVDGVVRLRRGLTASQVQRALQHVGQHYKVLRFQGIERAFGGWDTSAEQLEFEAQLRKYTTSWCCARVNPARIWYDFFWDQVPRIDRHGQLVHTPWQPLAAIT